MSFQSIVDAVLNPVFGWLLDIPSLVAILLLSLLLGVVSTLLQKYMTDQAKMRRLKDDTKKLQKQLKEAQKEKDTERMMKLQQKMMPLQMDLLKESFRPLLITMIPFLVIFFWLNSHFGYYPIEPGQPFTVTAVFQEGLSGNATLAVPGGFVLDEATKRIEDGQAAWTLTGPEGRHRIGLQYAGAQVEREILITGERSYIAPQMRIGGSVEEFNVGNEKLIPLGDFNLFGWHPGWIFWYILFSIPISLGLKKLLNVV